VRNAKTVTPRKIEANRRNSECSTGPRTERGKRNSRFNALTLGLFAKHVVIPVSDGFGAERDFQLLLEALHQEFEPTGFYEEWLVTRVAQSMWRLRRATRCERGSVQVASALWEPSRNPDHNEHLRLLRMEMDIWALTDAEQQLRDSGALSQEIFDRISPLLHEQQRKAIQPDRSIKPDNLRDFLARLIDFRGSLELTHGTQSRRHEERSEIRSDHEALLPEADMERILRYEDRMHRYIDWAVQKLLESREKRKTVETPVGPLLLPARKSVERSQ
jgi:hypothetical protein